jgi:hypothetical protein
VYVIRDVHQSLLGRDAIDALDIVQRIHLVNSTIFDPVQEYAYRFTGLGCMSGEYSIHLQQAGVITRIEQPTECMVCANSGGSETYFRNTPAWCADFSHLNASVKQQQYTVCQ